MKTLYFASCLVVVLAGAAQASGSIAYEGVAYSPGALTGDGPAAGFAGPWIADPGVNVVATGLSSAFDLPSMGGSVSGFFDFVDPLMNTIAPAPGKEFWASFLLYHSGPNDQSYMGLSPAGAALGSPPSAAIGVRLGQYGVFVGGTFTGSGKAFTPNGTTDFLVAHFVSAGAVWNVTLFVNQNSFVIPDLATTVPAVTYGTMVNQNQAEFGSDEYRLGDTAGDVSAAGATPAVGGTWGRVKAQYH
jgi:hypothetical protein